MKKMYDGVDKVFYFVVDGLISLKEVYMDSIASDIVEKFGYEMCLMRSGHDVEDPNQLYAELAEVDFDKIDIVHADKDSDVITLFGDIEKEKFLEYITSKELVEEYKYSGLIAKKIIDEIDYPPEEL
jgi:hypothetical protein